MSPLRAGTAAFVEQTLGIKEMLTGLTGANEGQVPVCHHSVISFSPSVFPLLSPVSPSEVVEPPHVINNQEECLFRV